MNYSFLLIVPILLVILMLLLLSGHSKNQNDQTANAEKKHTNKLLLILVYYFETILIPAMFFVGMYVHDKRYFETLAAVKVGIFGAIFGLILATVTVVYTKETLKKVSTGNPAFVALKFAILGMLVSFIIGWII